MTEENAPRDSQSYLLQVAMGLPIEHFRARMSSCSSAKTKFRMSSGISGSPSKGSSDIAYHI